MAVIGLDVGTSGVKSTVLDDNARVIAHAYREYDLLCPAEGQYELDPRVLLKGALEVIRESAGKAGTDIEAISVTSFGESFVCLDERDEVLSNTMIYMDKRGAEECAEYLALRSEMDIFARCGHYVDPMFGIYKIRWMQKHCPKLMAKMRRICFIADFITYKLGAAHKCDYSLAARSAMFDVFHKAWIDEALAFAGLDRAMLPEAVPGGSTVGEVSPAIAQELGLGAGVKLIVAGHDQVAAVMGSGAWEAGETANGMGTTDCITAVLSAEGLDYEALIRNSLTLVPYLDSGRFVTYAFNVSGGCAVKWFRDTLAKDIAEREDAYALLNQETPSEPTDLIVLPYLAGSGTPYMDGNTPCVFAGLRLGTDRGKLFRGLLEGETYEMMVNIECLKECGVEVEKVITVGGGSSSPLWMQIRADIFGRDIYLPENKEAGTLGTAILCYVGMGRYASIPEAQKKMISFSKKFTPDAASHAHYAAKYQKYKKLYAMVKELFA